MSEPQSVRAIARDLLRQYRRNHGKDEHNPVMEALHWMEHLFQSMMTWEHLFQSIITWGILFMQ